jgi:hypothetical protein
MSILIFLSLLKGILKGSQRSRFGATKLFLFSHAHIKEHIRRSPTAGILF